MCARRFFFHMRNLRFHFPFSALSLCLSAVAVLLVVYIGLIAVVMSYAASTVAFSQSVKNGSAVVAALESEYLTSIAHIAEMDYVTAGYAKPSTKIFVRAQNAALR
jgi:hypothetical protein